MITKLYENDKLHEAFENAADLKPLINSEYEDVISAIKEAIEADDATDIAAIDQNLTPKMNLAGIMNDQLQDAFTRRNVPRHRELSAKI